MCRWLVLSWKSSMTTVRSLQELPEATGFVDVEEGLGAFAECGGASGKYENYFGVLNGAPKCSAFYAHKVPRQDGRIRRRAEMNFEAAIRCCVFHEVDGSESFVLKIIKMDRLERTND